MNMGKGIAFGTILSLVSLGVSAQVASDIEATGDSYVSSGGAVLKTGLDDCLHTGTFSEDSIINACEGIEEVAEVEVIEKVVEEPVAAPTELAQAPAAAAAPQGQLDIREFSEQALFDSNSAQLTNAGEAAMQAMFSALAEYQDITAISVIGHTDSRGEDAYNQTLSEQRAQTIADVIASQYSSTSIAVEGLGESSPIASNDTAEGRQLNRRVEITVTASRMIFN